MYNILVSNQTAARFLKNVLQYTMTLTLFKLAELYYVYLCLLSTQFDHMAIIVGIGGVSRAGKTFLAEKIALERPSGIRSILPQDEFVKPKHEIPLINGHIDWESPESIDFPGYKNAIIKASVHPGILIAEGLLTFFDPGIVQLFNKIIFISLTFEEFRRRKQTDLRWGKEPEWYIRHIWDSYLHYGQCPAVGTDTMFIKGEMDFNIAEVMKFIDS